MLFAPVVIGRSNYFGVKCFLLAVECISGGFDEEKMWFGPKALSYKSQPFTLADAVALALVVQRVDKLLASRQVLSKLILLSYLVDSDLFNG